MAEYGSAGSGREKTFGRSLMSYIQSSLPYGQSHTIIDGIEKLNPKFKDFYDTGTRRQELISKHSIFSTKEGDINPMASLAVDKNYHSFMYANVDYDKSKRLRDYRVMAQFAEVADALDEICDESINVDERGKFIKLDYDRLDLDSTIKQEILNEFDKFISLYQFETKGWEYFRQLLVDREIYF